ncbi:hypothetical protein P691DRAFT_671751, partial [Macrolepiota fuliginosa MF-IS2]
YPDPQEFRPREFLTSGDQLRTDGEILDPTNIIFGFGRRFMALPAVGAASLSGVFNIGKALNSNGQPIEPTRAYDSSAIS